MNDGNEDGDDDDYGDNEDDDDDEDDIVQKGSWSHAHCRGIAALQQLATPTAPIVHCTSTIHPHDEDDGDEDGDDGDDKDDKDDYGDQLATPTAPIVHKHQHHVMMRIENENNKTITDG